MMRKKRKIQILENEVKRLTDENASIPELKKKLTGMISRNAYMTDEIYKASKEIVTLKQTISAHELTIATKETIIEEFKTKFTAKKGSKEVLEDKELKIKALEKAITNFKRKYTNLEKKYNKLKPQ